MPKRIVAKRNSIATRFVAWFLLLSILPLATITNFIYTNFEQTLRAEIEHNLLALADSKAKHIEKYMEERQKDAAIFGHTTLFIDLITKLDQTKTLSGPHSLPYLNLVQRAKEQLLNYAGIYSYTDILLVSNAGELVFSLQNFMPLGTNLYADDQRNTALGKVFDKSLTFLRAEISDYTYYPPTKQAAIFVAAPILKDKQPIGSLIFQMDNAEVNDITNDYIGLGQTGEVLIGMQDGENVIFVNPLRHDPHAAFQRKVMLGSTIGVPVQNGVLGLKGSGVSTDYRGHEVLAAWQYMPNLRWGMVAKIHTTEAFKAILAQRNAVLVLEGGTFLLIILAAFFVARSISTPLLRLTKATRSVAKGDLTTPIPVSGKDEIGELAEAFQWMVARVASAFQTLQASELKYRTIFEDSKDTIFITTPDGTIKDISPAIEMLTGYTREEAIQRKAQDFYADPNVRLLLQQKIALFGEIQDFEYQLRRKDGTLVEALVNLSVEKAADGTIVGYQGVIRDISLQKEALLQAQLIKEQQLSLRELSTPLIPLAANVLAFPLIGHIDPVRAELLMHTILRGVEQRRAQVAIMDITGVPVVDTYTADILIRTAKAVKLLGSQVVLTGIRPDVAQTLVHLGTDLGSIVVCSTLQDGVAYALKHQKKSNLSRKVTKKKVIEPSRD